MKTAKEEVKPDYLKVTTVTPAGKFSRSAFKGAGYLTVSKGQGLRSDQIAVEVEHSQGEGSFKKLKPRKTALINITFASGRVWSGSFLELEARLFFNIKHTEYLGQCDKIRRTPEGQELWDKLMEKGTPISKEDFMANVDPSTILDEGEGLDDWMAGDPEANFYHATVAGRAYYFIKHSGFEFIWKHSDEG